MGSKSEEKSTLKRSWFQELKAEFHKIIWPDKNSLVKQSIAVIIIAIIVGCIVALVDMGLMEGLKALNALVQQLG
ncbi:MAG: preprotein translocase subunit SecE [Bacteroides sp.]|nr:preprotein translocase subunit SecE [Bacteroides sp.]MCM1549093.1 preprotein translocase subunit SecE [Clostridium sp.]